MNFRGTLPGAEGGNPWNGAPPYRYHRKPGWNPAAAVPPAPARTRGAQSLASQQEHAAQRRARFAELRAQGMPVAEAGAAVGVGPDTAVKYERRRRREAGGAP